MTVEDAAEAGAGGHDELVFHVRPVTAHRFYGGLVIQVRRRRRGGRRRGGRRGSRFAGRNRGLCLGGNEERREGKGSSDQIHLRQ